MNDRIVVGVDGSGPSDEAVVWAAKAAEREHRELHLYSMYQLHSAAYAVAPVPQDVIDRVRTDAEALVRDAADKARAAAPEIEITASVADSRPAVALIDASKTASMVVVGSRGLGGASGLLLGSVGAELASNAYSPVAIVRGAADATEGPVVVGVDGSKLSQNAVAEAFRQASFRNAKLVAVQTWSDLPDSVFAGYGLDESVLQSEIDEARESLGERLAGYSEQYPDVVVERVVSPAGPVEQLLESSKNAQLLVVGSRGRGGFAGLLLGSTSQALLHKATVPLMVVR